MPARSSIASSIASRLGSVLPRHSVWSVLVWPATCIATALILWTAIESMIAQERILFNQSISSDATLVAGGYARYVSRSIEHLDHLTTHIRYDWKHTGGTLRLDELARQGLFTAPHLLEVAIADRHGTIVTSTVPASRQISIAGDDYFISHINNISSALQISNAELNNAQQKTVIRFTRRLDTSANEFSGVVILLVEPEYFSAFHDGASIGQSGFLAVVGTDGMPRFSQVAGKRYAPPGNTGDHLWEPGKPANAQIHSASGDQWMAGGAFMDNERRYMAWQRLAAYPLTAVVGLSERERFAPYLQNQQAYRRFAVWGSMLLMLFAAVAGIMTWHLQRRRRQEHSVQAAYRLATESGDEGFYMLHPVRAADGVIIDFTVLDCNARGAALLGTKKSELLGQLLSYRYPSDEFHRMLEAYRHAMQIGFYEEEARYSAIAATSMSWVRRRLMRSGDALAVTLRDITQSKAHEHELTRLANTDDLTGLPNRSWLMKLLDMSLPQAHDANEMVALLFIDLDHFKNVNDALGHSAGDALLRDAAQRLQATLRPTDHVARLGGDEFTVVLSPVSNEHEATRVAERIINAFHPPFAIAGTTHQVSTSVGISLFPQDGENAETLLKNADIAMYSAKANGRGRYCVFRKEQFESLRARISTEQALREAIRLDQFELHYQPRIDTHSGQLLGMEALVRWNHPQRGLISPLEFIPLAEGTGLIVGLGALVIEKACQQFVQWRTDQMPPVAISINVSAVQFHHGDISEVIASCLTRFDIEPQWIELEITESSMLGDHAGIAEKLAAIRALGIRLAVDDFGTGYSSLSQLQRLDMDVLKVDRTFTADLGVSTEGTVFFKAMVSMAHALGMRVVAEGVETQQQAAMLRELGCDELQGYLISRPLPAEDMQAMMRDLATLQKQSYDTVTPLRVA